MFDLVLHDVIFGLFECYLFLAYWFFRLSFLDCFVEKLLIKFGEKHGFNIVLAYKNEKETEVVKNGKNEINGKNEVNGQSEQLTATINDGRVLAKIAAYPTLGLAEGFIVSTFELIIYLLLVISYLLID